MNRILAILVAATALPTLACDSGGGEYVKKMEEFAEKACACKDTDCVTELSKEQADWLTKNAETASKLNAKDAEKIGAATTKMSECMTKIATGG
jgi:hypothetical protein